MERKIAPAKFKIYTNEGGWTDHGRHLTSGFRMKVESWIRDHDSNNYLELLAAMHAAVEEAWLGCAIDRKFCTHEDVPDDDDYCEQCGARLEPL